MVPAGHPEILGTVVPQVVFDPEIGVWSQQLSYTVKLRSFLKMKRANRNQSVVLLTSSLWLMPLVGHKS